MESKIRQSKFSGRGFYIQVFSCFVVAVAGRILEQGVSFVGTDYLSHLLWDKFIEFEYSQLEWSRLAQIYTRILQIPLQHLDRYHTRYDGPDRPQLFNQ